MKKNLLWILLWTAQQYASVAEDTEAFMHIPDNQNVVIATKRIELKDFPEAFNPSLLKIDQGYLLSFRYIPAREESLHISYIGVVVLDANFDQIAEPQLLRTRQKKSKTPSQAEDARLFSYRGRIFLIYNDNVEKEAPTLWQRRDMYMAEVFNNNGSFSLSGPLKLSCSGKNAYWEKNWVPFQWNNTFLLSYSIDPHEVIYPNLINGECYPSYQTQAILGWDYGTIRGGTPAILVDGEYLAFFHSGILTRTEASWGWDLWHYFMGAYTFAAKPPFEIEKITSQPIIGHGFYTKSGHPKRVIFPGGFVDAGPLIYLAYGKDDYEIWIATLDKHELKKILQPVVVAKNQ